ncbi:MAG TPA: Wzz/FepE/Etk N-terminal domain-containing protein, partial [Candidatus Contendobacter sp.]|nr:Wzz/FepE/Etk N-terminal domain-containing protein [Candidatus Contendobacter sp.]
MSTPELPKSANPEPRPPGQALAERPAGVPIPAPPPQAQTVEEESEGDELNLRELWQVIVKRRWTILIFALIVVTAVVTATFLMTPIYRASLTLQIDREDIKIVQTGEVTPEESGRGGQDYYQT